jgi:hypothetical protein
LTVALLSTLFLVRLLVIHKPDGVIVITEATHDIRVHPPISACCPSEHVVLEWSGLDIGHVFRREGIWRRRVWRWWLMRGSLIQ